MKKIEKKLIRAIYKATINGRLEWEYANGGDEFHASLPEADYTAVIQNDHTRTISIHSASGEFMYVIRPSTIKMRPTASRILEHAKNSQTDPKVILSGIADALVAETISCHSGFGSCPCDVEILGVLGE